VIPLPRRFLLLFPVLLALALLAPTPALTHAKTAPPKASKQQAKAKGKNKNKNKAKPKTVKRTKPVLIGIADQKSSFLADPVFLGLGVRYARVAVAWDALHTDWQVDELERWMSNARAAGVQPLVTFDRSRLEGRGRILPTPAQFVAEFRAFRARYPWVRDYSAWNEANFPGQETYRHPDLVARYYKAMRRACATCRVLGADLLDIPSMTKWVKKFVKIGGQPRYWGLHNYVTANRFQTARTQELLNVSKGEIWLTETGGLVARRNKSLIKLPQGPAHAAKVTRFILRDLVALSPRITRVYLYQWNTDSHTASWDSGFVGPDERARPSLDVLEQELLASRPR